MTESEWTLTRRALIAEMAVLELQSSLMQIEHNAKVAELKALCDAWTPEA